MAFDDELKELQDWCREETDKCMSMPYIPFDDTANIEAKKVFQRI